MKLFMCFAVLQLVTLICAEQNLEEQELQQIEPISQNEDASLKDQSKRTIFGPKQIDWAKHVGLNARGHKHVLGYGPVDYKYVPVIKPLILKPLSHMHGWRSVFKPVKVKPVHLLPVNPVRKPFHQGHQAHQGGWRPMIPANVPLPPIHPTRPWKEGWPENKPSITLQPPLSASGQHEVVIKPSAPSPSAPPPGPVVRPVVDVRPVLEPPVTHLQPVPPFPDVVVQPTFPTNQLVPIQPFVPQSPPLLYPEQIHPLIPFDTSIFQFQKPQLPVLPLGATFPAEVLHAKPVFPQAAPVHPAFPPPHQAFHIHPSYAAQPLQPNFPVPPPIPHPVFGHSPPVLNTHHVQPFFPSQPAPPFQPAVPVQPAIPLQPVQPVLSRPAIPQSNFPLNPSPIHPPLSFPVQSGVEFHGKAAHLIPLTRPIFGPHLSSQQPHLIPQVPQVPQGNANPGIAFHNTHGINHPAFVHHLQPVHPQIPHLNPNDGHFNPSVPQTSNGHFNPGVPQIPDGNLNPNVPQIPDGHFNPGFPQIHHGHFSPNVPQIPGAHFNPNFAQIPDAHFNPNVPQIPDAHFNPNVPQIPDANLNPNVPQIPDGHFNPGVPQIPDGHFNPAAPQIPNSHFNPGVQTPQNHFVPGNPQEDSFNIGVPQQHFPQENPQNNFNPPIHEFHGNFNPGPQQPQDNFNPGFGIHQQPQEPQQPSFSFHPANPEVPQHFLPNPGNDRFPTLNLDPAENLPEPQPQPFRPNNQPEQSGQPNFSIQPGQTDIQIPFHLPSHPGFRQNDVNVFQQNPQPDNNFPNSGDGTQEQPFNGYVK